MYTILILLLVLFSQKRLPSSLDKFAEIWSARY